MEKQVFNSLSELLAEKVGDASSYSDRASYLDHSRQWVRIWNAHRLRFGPSIPLIIKGNMMHPKVLDSNKK